MALASCAAGDSYCTKAMSDLTGKNQAVANSVNALMNGDTWEGIKTLAQKANEGDHDPTPKSCSIQKQNSGMIMTPLNGGCADEKVTIHRRADCFCPEAG
jgi:hypothetical protein